MGHHSKYAEFYGLTALSVSLFSGCCAVAHSDNKCPWMCGTEDAIKPKRLIEIYTLKAARLIKAKRPLEIIIIVIVNSDEFTKYTAH